MAELIRVEGFRELERALRQLPDKIETRVLGKALKTGAGIVEDAARNTALAKFQGEGFMAEHIGSRAVRKSKLTGFDAARWIIGVLSDIKGGGLVKVNTLTGRDRKTRRASKNKTALTGFANSGAYYWRFLEFGTVKMPPRPFLRPAFENNRLTVLARITQQIRRGITLEVKKLAKGPRA